MPADSLVGGNPTKITIHDLWDLVIGACPASSEHPHVLLNLLS
ncbi:hypothetical protein ACIHAX_16790 [Nocardia sp. NPDC051929]